MPASLPAVAPYDFVFAVVNCTAIAFTLATCSNSQLPTLTVALGAPCRLMSRTSSPATRQSPAGAVVSVAELVASALTANEGDSAQVRFEVTVSADRSTSAPIVDGGRHT